MTKSNKTASKKNAPSMNADLTKKVTELKKLLNERTRADAKTLYCIARAVVEIKGDEKKYGKGSVKRLATELGYTAANLYAYAKVAEVWNQEAAFEHHLKAVSDKGFSLSFSHFVELAGVDVGEDRNALMKRALDECMSVRDVAAEVRKLNPPEPRKNKRTMEAVLPATISRPGLLGVAEAAFESAKADIDALTEALVHGGTPTPEEREESIKRLEDAIGLYQHALEELRSPVFEMSAIRLAAE